MVMGGCSLVRLLKFITSSLVLLMFSGRLLLWHQLVRVCTNLKVREFDNDVGAVCGYTVTCVQGVQERTENTTLRAPLLRVSGEEMLPPTLTTCCLPVRKSRIQPHKDLFRQTTFSHVFLLSSGKRAVCRGKASASSVEWLLRKVNCSGLSDAVNTEQMRCLTSCVLRCGWALYCCACM